MKKNNRTIWLIIFMLLLFSPVDIISGPLIGWTDDMLYIVGIIYQILQIVKSSEVNAIEMKQ